MIFDDTDEYVTFITFLNQQLVLRDHLCLYVQDNYKLIFDNLSMIVPKLGMNFLKLRKIVFKVAKKVYNDKKSLRIRNFDFAQYAFYQRRQRI